MKEVLPGQLFWAPEVQKLPAGRNGLLVDVLELGSNPEYNVHHYSAKALGEAFGPYALDQILVFCRRLKALLVSQSCGQQPPVYLTCRRSEDAHTNSSVLVGAFLVLVKNWPATKIVETLGQGEADRKFPCSWQQFSKRLMPVVSCWEGLELAVTHGWIDRDCMSDDTHTDFACSRYRSMVATFDATWLIPGKLMVSADPVTTVDDPNPVTFKSLWCTETPVQSFHSGIDLNTRPSEDSVDDSKSDSTADPDWMLVRNPSHADNDKAGDKNVFDIDDGTSSVETVCKEYQNLGPRNEQLVSLHVKSFNDFLQESEVKLVIRCNFLNERGMPRPSDSEENIYSPEKFRQHGINHTDIQFVDKNGGLPERSHVAAALAAGTSMKTEAGAILVHCKGGFGRSVVLACCIAIYTLNVPGRALLGWVRIVRPGAITTAQQEEFLLSFKGRADVARYAGVLQTCCQRKDVNKTPPGCAPACVVM